MLRHDPWAVSPSIEITTAGRWKASTSREATIPHEIARSTEAPKTVVIVGAGPAGLEAARVSGERGHNTILIEAMGEAGGQIRLAAQNKRRRELIGIVDWRLAQCQRLGVDIRYNTIADAGLVQSLAPDMVIVATGGVPQNNAFTQGAELAVSSWEIVSGEVKPAEDVLVFDDNGAHPGLSAAERVAESGGRLEIVSPERFFSPEMGGLNLVPYMKSIVSKGGRITTMTRVTALARHGNKIKVTLWSPYSLAECGERLVDQVVVENGTTPLAELYFDLKDLSLNRGAVDYDALAEGRPQTLLTNPDGRFRLFRIGDAVASRNIHAAIYDAIRLLKDF